MKNYAKVFIQAVRDGKMHNFSIDPDNPAMTYEPIDIDAPKGQLCQVHGAWRLYA